MSDLRDHSQPCEHDQTASHNIQRQDGIVEGWCPGGREVTIDYEAAAKVLANRIIGARSDGPRRAAREAVDAAIGDTEIRQAVKEIVEQDQELLDKLAET